MELGPLKGCNVHQISDVWVSLQLPLGAEQVRLAAESAALLESLSFLEVSFSVWELHAWSPVTLFAWCFL